MRKLKLLFATLVLCLTFAACSFRGTKVKGTLPPTPIYEDGAPIDGQTVPQDGIYLPDAKLHDGFYIQSGGYLYELYSMLMTSDRSRELSSVNSNRRGMQSLTTEKYIPTLFLNKGDKLLYYSETQLLDTIEWERFFDFGYTVGFFDIYAMQNGRLYIDLTDEDTILPMCELYELYALTESDESPVKSVLLDKIGGIPVRDNILSHGMLTGMQKGQVYDFDLYIGSQYLHKVVSCNTHMFYMAEAFISTEYETLKASTYEIEVPDYLVNGYYYINNVGFFRLCLDDSYDTNTDFNEQLLYPDAKGNIYAYSDNPKFCSYTTDVFGALGSEIKTLDEDFYALYEYPEFNGATVCNKKYLITDSKTAAIEVASEKADGDVYIVLKNGDKYLLSYNVETGTYQLNNSGLTALRRSRNNDVFDLSISGMGDEATSARVIYKGVEPQ